MAYNIYKSSAWQSPSATKRYANGAWQSCESVKRYVSGAWQNVWNSAVYFMKSGVFMGDAFAMTGDYVYQPTLDGGYLEFTNGVDFADSEADIYIPAETDLYAGKTLYVVAWSKYTSMRMLDGENRYFIYDKELGYGMHLFKYENLHTLPYLTRQYIFRLFVSADDSVSIKDIYIA